MLILFVTLFLFIAAVFDIKTYKIPNWLHLIGIIVALALYITGVLEFTFVKMIVNVMIVFIPLFLLWFISTLLHFKAIGAGDIKLFTVIAFYLPLFDTYLLILLTIVLSGIIALTMIKPKRFFEMFSDLSYFLFYGIPGKSEKTMVKIPLAPILFIVYLFYLTPFYDYFSAYWR